MMRPVSQVSRDSPRTQTGPPGALSTTRGTALLRIIQEAAPRAGLRLYRTAGFPLAPSTLAMGDRLSQQTADPEAIKK